MFPFPYGRWKHVSLHLTSSQTHLWFFLLPIIFLKFEKGWLVHVRASRSGTHYSRAILFHHHVSSGPLRAGFYFLPFIEFPSKTAANTTPFPSPYIECVTCQFPIGLFSFNASNIRDKGTMGQKENLPNIFPRGYIQLPYFGCEIYYFLRKEPMKHNT